MIKSIKGSYVLTFEKTDVKLLSFLSSIIGKNEDTRHTTFLVMQILTTSTATHQIPDQLYIITHSYISLNNISSLVQCSSLRPKYFQKARNTGMNIIR